MARSEFYAIDVGTTKVVALAGRVDVNRGWVEVNSVGEAPSSGLRRGVIVDRHLAAESIARAVDLCGGFGREAVVGIAGSHISSRNVEVTLLNRGRNLQITPRFLKKLDNEAGQRAFEPDKQVVNIVPRTYVLDGTEGVKSPGGLSARKVLMRAHVVSGAVSSIQNLVSAVEDAGVRVSDIYLEPLASAEACLTGRDRESGVALLDIGGGTSDLAVFVGDSLVHTDVIPLGGQSLTSDAAYGLKVSLEDAESLKVRYGTVLSSNVDSVAAVRLGDRHYNASFLSQILEYRAREILDYVSESLEKNDVSRLLANGLVLTGGGSQLDGMAQLTEQTLGHHTRSAVTHLLRGKSKPVRKPQYSTSVGLLYLAAKNSNPVNQSKGAGNFSFGSIAEAVRRWFGR